MTPLREHQGDEVGRSWLVAMAMRAWMLRRYWLIPALLFLALLAIIVVGTSSRPLEPIHYTPF